MATVFPQALAARMQDPAALTWQDPFEAERKRLLERMAMPAAPTYTPEQVEQRRAQNQREYELGLLGTLSGNEQLGQVGGTVLKRALAQRDPRVSERGSTDQITGQFTYSPDYLRQRDETALRDLETKSAASRGSFEAARAAALERAALAADRDQARRDAKSGADDARKWRGEDTLRGDYDRLTKDLREEVNATGKITQLIAANAGRRPDAITQQSLVILLNKFLDPGSVVREGEFDRVVRAQGLEGRASNLRDYILAGEPLSAGSIAQINSLANLYSQAAQAKMRSIGAEYVRIAEGRGFDPANVITDAAYRGGGPAPAAAGGGAIDVGAMLGGGKPAVPGLQAVPLTGPKPAPQVSALPKATGKDKKQQPRTVQVEY